MPMYIHTFSTNESFIMHANMYTQTGVCWVLLSSLSLLIRGLWFILVIDLQHLVHGSHFHRDPQKNGSKTHGKTLRDLHSAHNMVVLAPHRTTPAIFLLYLTGSS